MNWTPQQLAIFNHCETSRKSLNVQARAGCSKCLGSGTPVMKFDGSIVPVEYIKVGDQLMGPDSQPRTVVSTTTGKDRLYRITPVKGEPWVCNAPHVMTFIGTNREEGKIIDIPLEQYLDKYKHYKYLDKNWKLFRVPLNFVAIDVPYDPYIMGSWLGDGTFDGPQWTLGYDKDSVLQYLKANADKCACIPVLRHDEDNHSWNIRYSVGPRNAGIPNAFWRYLSRDFKTEDGQKCIPQIYLMNQRSVRLSILAGLLDTDGHHNGSFQITTKYQQLRDDILFLARSLGFAAYTWTKFVKLYGWQESK